VIRRTARRSNLSDDDVGSGKTGSCSDAGSRRGWFVSCLEELNRKRVLVIRMRANTDALRGRMASGIAGRIYEQFQEKEYNTRQGTGRALRSDH
jgi:beta-lactamase class D